MMLLPFNCHDHVKVDNLVNSEPCIEIETMPILMLKKIVSGWNVLLDFSYEQANDLKNILFEFVDVCR